MISVCIATYRGASRLRELLSSITNEAEPDDVEVVVVDDGSPDGDAQAIVEVVRSMRSLLRVSLLREPVNRGYAACIHAAIASSKGDRILLMDDNTLAAPGLFGTLRWLMSCLPNVGVLSWRSEGYRPGQSIRPVPGLIQPATQLNSYCYAFRQSVWNEVGGFDTGFRFFFIDSDFCIRVTQAGHPCYRVWWPLVPHFEHGGAGGDTVPFSRQEIAKQDMDTFVRKWGCSPDEMEQRALKGLEERSCQ